ncbi:MAG: hypothetical protein GX957_03025 [Clostridiaceae bacterium]|nr:hypothetical protein [Clostridiaceae bacterium]
MRQGYFNDEKKEYRIEDMFPKRPWLNYMWNKKLLMHIDQFGFGPSTYMEKEGYYRDLCKKENSRLLFIRDEKTKEFWSANRNFDKKNFQEFYTDVGLGYSSIHSVYNDVEADFKIYAPTSGAYECWIIEIKNVGQEDKSLSLFTYADVVMNITGHMAYNRGSFNSEINGVLLNHHGFDLPTKLEFIYFACDKKPVAFETSNMRFKGVYGSIHNPDALANEYLSSMETTFDDKMIAALQHKIYLKPGEGIRLNFLLGLSENTENAIESCNRLLSDEAFDLELEKVTQYNDKLTEGIQIKTPEPQINSLANIWLKRQMDLGKVWGRGITKGFRDIMQDVTGIMPNDPEGAADRIKYCLNYQYENGNTLRQWSSSAGNSGDDAHPYRDGASWIVPAVVSYIKETGDFAILDEVVPYFGGKTSGTVFDHCKRGIDFLLSELGEHGLCLWEGGDWNDSLNNVGMNLIGESVWLSMATLSSTKEFIELLKRIGKYELIDEYEKKSLELKNNILKHGWDKDHFIYGINDWNEKVGAYESEQAKIFLNPQTWAVLSEVVTGEEAERLLDFVETELKTPYGYVQLKPSFSKGDPHIGRISYMEKGCYENGSVYNHGVAFKIAADCKLLRSNQAYNSVIKMLSINPENPSTSSGVEPYVVTNMFLGNENDLRPGESLMSWTTGSAGWLFRCITEFIIGIQAGYDGLVVSPCMPSAWRDVKVQRRYRNATYNISILNPEGLEKGNLRIKVDSAVIDGNVIPPISDEKIHEVIVEIQP